MTTRTYAPRDASNGVRYASQSQIDWILKLLEGKQIPDRFSGDAERLWKMCEAHDINERTPGDGTLMQAATASRAIDWLKKFDWTPRAPRQDQSQQGTRPAFPEIPAGSYATKSRTGRNDLDFWTIDRPTEGKWAGKTFVNRFVGGQGEIRISYAEQLAAATAILAAGTEQAGRLFGQEIGQCRFCHRPLTRRVPRYNGQGNDCADQRGLVQEQPPADWRPEIQDDPKR